VCHEHLRRSKHPFDFYSPGVILGLELKLGLGLVSV
jgi:hypothetical protein